MIGPVAPVGENRVYKINPGSVLEGRFLFNVKKEEEYQVKEWFKC